MAPVRSSFMAVTSSVHYSGHKDAGRKKANERDITANGYLSQTAQTVTAGSPVGQPRSEHQNDTAEKGGNPTLGPGGSEALLPHRRYGYSFLF